MSLFTANLRKKYLSTEEKEPNKTYIANNLTTRLTENEKKHLDVELTLQELTIALGSMKKGKTPGSNGFSVEFFRYFWKHLGVFLY